MHLSKFGIWMTKRKNAFRFLQATVILFTLFVSSYKVKSQPQVVQVRMLPLRYGIFLMVLASKLLKVKIILYVFLKKSILIKCVKIGHTDTISSICQISNDIIASGSYDSTIKIWRWSSGKCEKTLKQHHFAILTICTIDENTIASGSDDCSIMIWDIKKGSMVLDI